MREEALEEWTPVSPSDQSVRVVRPLRDIGTKECAAYAWWKGLVVVGKDKWPSTSQGIGKLTKGRFYLTRKGLFDFFFSLKNSLLDWKKSIRRLSLPLHGRVLN